VVTASSLGVSDIRQISSVEGIADDGRLLPRWCDEHQLRSILVVATKGHYWRLW